MSFLNTIMNAFGIGKSSSVLSGINSFTDQIGSLINSKTGAHLTGAQQEQNAYETEMANTVYQRGVADMQKAGLNPALMYGSGSSGSPAPAGASGSVGQGFGELVNALLLPLQLKQMKANIANIGKDIELKDANRRNIDANTANVEQDTQNKGVSFEQQQLNLKFDTELYKSRKESIELANERQRAEIAVTKERRNEIVANINKLIAETGNEVFRGFLLQAETSLRKAEAYKIYSLLPFEQDLLSAQTEAQRAAASLSTVQAAIQQGLLDGGYVEKQLSELDGRIQNLKVDYRYKESQSDFIETQNAINELKRKIASGQAISSEDIPKWKFTDRAIVEFWNEFLQGCYALSTAITGPLVGAVVK